MARKKKELDFGIEEHAADFIRFANLYCTTIEVGLREHRPIDINYTLLRMLPAIYSMAHALQHEALIGYTPQLDDDLVNSGELEELCARLVEYFRAAEDEEEGEDAEEQNVLPSWVAAGLRASLDEDEEEEEDDEEEDADDAITVAGLLAQIYTYLRRVVDQFENGNEQQKGNAIFFAHVSFIVGWGTALLRVLHLLHQTYAGHIGVGPRMELSD